jgi:hypothetical protein
LGSGFSLTPVLGGTKNLHTEVGLKPDSRP